MRIKSFSKSVLVFILIASLSGCTFIFQTGRRSDVEKIKRLSDQLDELTQAKRLLEERLAKEIDDKQISLKIGDKGLVITFLADVLFDSGKAKIRSSAFPVLDQVARVLQENVPQLNVGIEGHTDNTGNAVKNKKLSNARANSVMNALITEGIDKTRLSAIGFGSEKPLVTNDSDENKAKNRRVELVKVN